MLGSPPPNFFSVHGRWQYNIFKTHMLSDYNFKNDLYLTWGFSSDSDGNVGWWWSPIFRPQQIRADDDTQAGPFGVTRCVTWPHDATLPGPVTTIMSLNSTATMTRIFPSPHISQYFSVTQYLSGPDCHGRRSNSKECSHCHVQITTAARDAGVGGDQGGWDWDMMSGPRWCWCPRVSCTRCGLQTILLMSLDHRCDNQW